MPTYGYRCESCQQEFDVWQRMTDEPGAPCPKCGGKGKRQFFPAGLVFKGSGFYVTDNRGSVPSSSSNGSGEGGGKTSKTSKPDSTTSKPDSGSTSSGSKTGTSSGAASGSSTE